MCAYGMVSLANTSAAPSVEFTSPGTNARVGGASSTIRSSACITRGRLLGVGSGADPEAVVRARHVELLEEQLGHLGVVVLSRVDEDMPVAREPASHLGDDRSRLDEVRSSSDDVEERHSGELAAQSRRPAPIADGIPAGRRFVSSRVVVSTPQHYSRPASPAPAGPAAVTRRSASLL